MKTKFKLYKELPFEYSQLRNLAFKNSKLNSLCFKIDSRSSHMTLFINDTFCGSVTITKNNIIELWSKQEVLIKEDYIFLNRGFITENISFNRIDLLNNILLEIIQTNANKNIFTSVRVDNLKVIKMLENIGFSRKKTFNSYHSITENFTPLYLYKISIKQT